MPRKVFEAIDVGSLELIQSDIVDHKLSERFSDALFRASFRGIPGYVWLLLEHQSEPDHWMTLRVLDYLVRFWLELVRREPERKSLPPVVCVVVHHGERGWTGPVRLQELVDGVRELSELRGLVPDFELIVDDLTTQSDELLASRPLSPLPKVVLWVLRDGRSIERFFQHLTAWAAELQRLARESPEDAATVMRYILTVAGDQSFEDIRTGVIEVAPAAEVTMATAAEQLIQQGRTLGKLRAKRRGCWPCWKPVGWVSARNSARES